MRVVFFIISWGWIAGICAQAPAIQWQRTIGGESQDAIFSAIQTTDGGYMLGGYTYSSNTGDKSDTAKGGWDTWLVKTDAAGTKLWDRSYGGNKKDGLVYMKQTTDGGYLFWAVSKTSANGDKSEPTRGLSDYWLVKLDSIGNIQWDKTIGGPNMDHILSVKETSDGGYLLGGFSISGAGGEKTMPSFGFWDYWLVKLDSLRIMEWDRSFGGTSSEHIMSVQELSTGGYLIGGFSSSGANGNKTESSRGIYDYWVVRTDKAGNKLWEKAYGGSLAEEMRAGIKITASGHYILGGFSQSGISGEKTDTARGEDDYWLIKTDTSGTIIWDKTIGGSRTEFLYSVIPTTDNGYLVAGWSDSPISGEKTDSSRGSYDFWIVKLAPDSATVGIENQPEINDITVTIFPNPFTNTATLLINTKQELAKPFELNIHDMTGKRVVHITGLTEKRIEISRKNLTADLYLYTLRNENATIAHGKLIIQ